MPETILPIAVLYVTVCLFRPLRPFTSRRQVALFGVPGLCAIALLLFMSPEPERPAHPSIAGWQRGPHPTSALSPSQERTRLDKLRGIDEHRMERELTLRDGQ